MPRFQNCRGCRLLSTLHCLSKYTAIISGRAGFLIVTLTPAKLPAAGSSFTKDGPPCASAGRSAGQNRGPCSWPCLLRCKTLTDRRMRYRCTHNIYVRNQMGGVLPCTPCSRQGISYRLVIYT